MRFDVNGVPMCRQAALPIGNLFLWAYILHRKSVTFTSKELVGLGVLPWSSLYTIMKQEKLPSSSPPALSLLWWKGVPGC